MSSDTGNPPPSGTRRVATTEMSLEARLQAASKTKQPSMEGRLIRLYRRESEVLEEFRGILDALKGQIIRVKTDGVKNNVEKLAALFDELMRSRAYINAECRATVVSERSCTDSLAAGITVSDKIAASETKILGALGAVSERLDSHDVLLSNLSLEKNNSRQGAYLAAQHDIADVAQRWTEVVRKPRRTAVNRPVDVKPKEAAKTTTRKPRTRPLAVIVKRDDEQFPDLLKTARSKVDTGIIGNAISKMRQTKTGSLLIQINGGAEVAKVVKDEVARSLGPDEAIRMTDDSTAVEIRDMDEMTTKEEVLEAVLALGDFQGAKVVSLRKAYGGTQTAVVLIPTRAAKRLCTTGRLRVGLVYARVRAAELPDRCYKCLAFGHRSRECTGFDRSSGCWRCGETGHQHSGYTATAQAAAAFNEVRSGRTKTVAHLTPLPDTKSAEQLRRAEDVVQTPPR